MNETQADIETEAGLTAEQEQRVRREVEHLAGCAGDYAGLHEAVVAKRLAWWEAHREELQLSGPLPRQAYSLVFLSYMGLSPDQVAVVYEDERRIVWHSTNFCPTLEACRRLGLDTRVVCRAATERSVEALIRQVDDRLRFGRNYDAGIRPHTAYCEEEIWMAE